VIGEAQWLKAHAEEFRRAGKAAAFIDEHFPPLSEKDREGVVGIDADCD
jgi:hypothetical protein